MTPLTVLLILIVFKQVPKSSPTLILNILSLRGISRSLISTIMAPSTKTIISHQPRHIIGEYFFSLTRTFITAKPRKCVMPLEEKLNTFCLGRFDDHMKVSILVAQITTQPIFTTVLFSCLVGVYLEYIISTVASFLTTVVVRRSGGCLTPVHYILGIWTSSDLKYGKNLTW